MAQQLRSQLLYVLVVDICARELRGEPCRETKRAKNSHLEFFARRRFLLNLLGEFFLDIVCQIGLLQVCVDHQTRASRSGNHGI